MAIDLLTSLKSLTFSQLTEPKIPFVITQNLVRVSIWGTVGSGATALVSFIFNRSLVQESTWKAFAPYVFKASLFSCTTFALVVAYCSKGIMKNRPIDSEFDKQLHLRVSLFAKGSTLVGLIGATAAFALRFVTPNSLIGSLANRSLSPLLGIGTAGSVLWLFLNSQNKQVAALNEKNQSNHEI